MYRRSLVEESLPPLGDDLARRAAVPDWRMFNSLTRGMTVMRILLAPILAALASAIPVRAQTLSTGAPVLRLDEAIAIATADNRQVDSMALAEQKAAEVTAAARTHSDCRRSTRPS